MGRGPVCGIITRLAGGPGTAGTADATAGSTAGILSVVRAELVAVGCSTVAVGGGGASAAAGGPCGARGAAGVATDAAGLVGFVSCGALFAGTATTADAAVNPDEGGFTITGPCGAREAMAGVGVGVGVAETICGACRGKGTIFRGAGFAPAAALAETIVPGAALTGVPAETGLATADPAIEELAAGAETVGLAGPAAAAVIVGRGGTAVTARCVPSDSRCSFCC